MIPDNTSDYEMQNKDSIEKVLRITELHPDKRVGQIFNMRYRDTASNKLTPWSEICEHVGLSVQGSINVHDQAIESIKNKLQKEI